MLLECILTPSRDLAYIEAAAPINPTCVQLLHHIYIYMDLYNRRWHKSLRAWILAFLVWWAANLMLAHFLEVRLDKISTRRFIASIPFESSMNRFMAGR